MFYHNITCERVQPPEPEAYICAAEDANKLALGLASEGKDCRIRTYDAIKGEKGMTGKPFAIVTVERHE